MSDDSLVVEEVGPGAFAIRKGTRVQEIEDGSTPIPAWVQQELPLQEPDFSDEEPTTESDPVNQPSHYLVGGIETLDFIEAKELGYHLGNVVKYVSRAGKKDPEKRLEDLLKARFYLDREIARGGK